MAEEPEDEVPYLLRGVHEIPTESSVLVSSSQYLNDLDLREWVAFIMLRRNGPDYPPELEMAELEQILPKVQGRARLEELVVAERASNPKFNAWLTAARRPKAARTAALCGRIAGLPNRCRSGLGRWKRRPVTAQPSSRPSLKGQLRHRAGG